MSGWFWWLEGLLKFIGVLSEGIDWWDKMVYSVIYLTVESSCRNCFYYHPKAGDDIIVLLGKFCLWRLFGVFYAGKNELHYLNCWMMVWVSKSSYVWFGWLHSLNMKSTPLLSVVKEGVSYHALFCYDWAGIFRNFPSFKLLSMSSRK